MAVGEYTFTGVYTDTGGNEGRVVTHSKVDADTASDLGKAILKLKTGTGPASIGLSSGLDPAGFPLHGNGASQPATLVLTSPTTGDKIIPTIGDVSTAYRVGVTNKLDTTHADLIAYKNAINAVNPVPGDYVFTDAHYD